MPSPASSELDHRAFATGIWRVQGQAERRCRPRACRSCDRSPGTCQNAWNIAPARPFHAHRCFARLRRHHCSKFRRRHYRFISNFIKHFLPMQSSSLRGGRSRASCGFRRPAGRYQGSRTILRRESAVFLAFFGLVRGGGHEFSRKAARRSSRPADVQRQTPHETPLTSALAPRSLGFVSSGHFVWLSNECPSRCAAPLSARSEKWHHFSEKSSVKTRF